MKISIVHIGNTQEPYLKAGMAQFEKRIRHYVSIEMIYLTARNSKHMPENQQKEAEGRLLLSAIRQTDHRILLDAAGREMDSTGFAGLLQQMMNRGTRNLGFIIGGPYGFSEEVYREVTDSLSLSRMTFSHQLVRLVFLEQLYRAFTIIRGEPYHHA